MAAGWLPDGLPYKAATGCMIKIKTTTGIYEDLLCARFFTYMVLTCQELSEGVTLPIAHIGKPRLRGQRTGLRSRG